MVAGAVHHRDLPPRQPGRLGVQAGWLALTTSKSSAPWSTGKAAWSRWVSRRVGGAHDAGEVQAVKQRLEAGHLTRRAADLALGEHGAVVVVQRRQQVHPGDRGGLSRCVLPSTASTRRGGGGGHSRSASQAPMVASTASPSIRASTRRMVASPGTWQRRVSGSPRTPSAVRTGPGASVAHSAIAVTDRAPAATAAALTARTLARGWRRPRRSRGRAASPAAPAGQGGRPRRAGGHARGRQWRRGWGMIGRQARVSVRS
jgi:hypothetical protein